MPRLYFIRLPVGHAYLWHDPDELHPHRHRPSRIRAADRRRDLPERIPARGLAAAGADALARRSHRGRGCRRFSWGEVEDNRPPRRRTVHPRRSRLGRRRTWPTGNVPSTKRRELHPPEEAVTQPRIDRELADGDELGFGDGAVAVAAPVIRRAASRSTSRAPGLLHATLWRAPRDGTVICGVFNVDRGEAAASLRRLASLGAPSPASVTASRLLTTPPPRWRPPPEPARRHRTACPRHTRE